jgi:hypothetical protein
VLRISAAADDIVERKRMKKWHIKLFRRLPSARVCILLITNRKKIGQIVFEVCLLNVPHSQKYQVTTVMTTP